MTERVRLQVEMDEVRLGGPKRERLRGQCHLCGGDVFSDVYRIGDGYVIRFQCVREKCGWRKTI